MRCVLLVTARYVNSVDIVDSLWLVVMLVFSYVVVGIVVALIVLFAYIVMAV